MFSIEEANGLVPELNERIGELLQVKDLIQELAAELYLKTSDAPVEEGAYVLDISKLDADTPAIQSLKRELSSRIGLYRDGWKDIEKLGAVVKDADSGLLDFYGRIDDRLVWLCWKYGETQIDHYHELNNGFVSRKPLTKVRERMLN